MSLDALVVVRAGDRTATAMVAVLAEAAGERSTVVHTSGEAELALRSRTRDVVVVDPDVVTVAALADDQLPGTPVVIGWLAVRSSARAALLLNAGADEVLDASMGDAELAARIRRAVQRRTIHVPTAPAVVGGLAVDARLHQASWHGTALPLTPRECEVLQVLVAAAGATVTREVIYRQVWRWAMPRGDRTVDVNVKRLRAKLVAAGVPVRIVTQPGLGYRLDVHGSSGPDETVVTGL